MDAVAIEKLVGTLCHFSQTWPRGKTLLWPLYKWLNAYRSYTPDGKPYIKSVKVALGGESKNALDEWYMRICTHGLIRKVRGFRGSHSVTRLGVWWNRKNRH